jgi:hypothetical protein
MDPVPCGLFDAVVLAGTTGGTETSIEEGRGPVEGSRPGVCKLVIKGKVVGLLNCSVEEMPRAVQEVVQIPIRRQRTLTTMAEASHDLILFSSFFAQYCANCKYEPRLFWPPDCHDFVIDVDVKGTVLIRLESEKRSAMVRVEYKCRYQEKQKLKPS